MFKEALASYYKNKKKNKEKIKKKSCERYQNLSEEGKNWKQKFGGEHYKNPSEDEKQKLVE